MAQTKIGVIIPVGPREAVFAPGDIARIDAMGDVRWSDSTKHFPVTEAVAFLKDCEIGVGSWGTAWPNVELLDGCPALRLWVHAAGSVRHMLGPHLEGRDLTIASCAPAIAENVAEITLGQLIIGLKRTLVNAAANRKGRARKPGNSQTLQASTVGVIGASHVGRRVIRNLGYFGTRILLCDPYVSTEEAAALGVELCGDLVQLCAEADAVTLHTPALPATEKMMGAAQFQAMKDDAVFVNTARGMCVDEDALIAELEQGRLFAFLDVSSPEPTPDDSPFRRLPNVVYTSHLAGGGDTKIGTQVADDIAAFLEDRPPVLAVTSDMLERIA